MFARSCGWIPVMVFTRISMPSPSGYCGAMRPMRHSGNTNPPASATAAAKTNQRERRVSDIGDPVAAWLRERLTQPRSHAVSVVAVLVCLRDLLRARELRLRALAHVRDERHVRAGGGHAGVALHLLVQRGAEVRAVEREDARPLRHPPERL